MYFRADHSLCKMYDLDYLDNVTQWGSYDLNDLAHGS